jgi:imidazolonepropionase-like amidohydrolase
MNDRTVLHVKGRILAGPEDVRDELWVVDGRISYDRPVAARDIRTVSGWALPGLVDAHCHVGLGPHGPVDQDVAEKQALADREAGTLLIRDAGSPSDTRWVDDREDLPKIIRAGRHIARTRRYIRGYAWEIEPEDLVAYVAQEARRGDGWVKRVGDWIDREVGDLAPLWPDDVLAPAIEAAHAAGARVTAHVFGSDALPGLIRAGIDCIEHGTGLTDELIDEMARRGTALVPTLINVETFPGIAERAQRYPTYAAHMRALHGRARGVVRRAAEAGVTVYTGTDAGGGIRHGRIADEVVALHAAGLPAVDALGAASWAARAWLGRPALVAGAPVDLVVYRDDPRVDPAALSHPELVLLRGRVYPG